MTLEDAYASDISRLTRVAELQRQIISNQEKMIESKDRIIEILTEQRTILLNTLSDIRNHPVSDSHSLFQIHTKP